MNAAPRLSVGLPVYNGEKYLAESLDALLGQSYGDFELIISDNASTDGTEEICREYLARDSRISYVRQPVNIGADAEPQLDVRAVPRRAVQVGVARRPVRPRPAAALCRGAGRRIRTLVLAHAHQAIIDGERRHRAEGRLPAGHRQPARAGAVPQPAVRRRRRRLLRRDALRHPAPYAAERQLPPLGPDDHGRARAARTLPPGAGAAVLPPGPPGPGRAGQTDHPVPVGEHGPAPGEPAAAPDRPAARRVHLRLRRRDPPGAAVVVRPAAVLRPPGSLDGRSRGPPGRRRRIEDSAPAAPPTAIPDSSASRPATGRVS